MFFWILFVQNLKKNLNFLLVTEYSINLGINLFNILELGFFLFFIALLGIFFNDRNLLFLIIYLDLLLLSISLNFVIFAVVWNDPKGLVMALFILAYAGAESAIGLAIFVSYFLYFNSLNVLKIGLLHG